MMEARELRIGNIIDRTDYECRVISIDAASITAAPLNYKGERFVVQEIKPIPLTEGWLVRFGFELVASRSNRVFSKGKDFGFDLGIASYLVAYYRHEDELSNIFIRHKVNYVHQLQNIYFALTGEELEMKE